MYTTLTILAAEEGNSFWLPHDLNEVIWGTLAFLIVAFLLWKFGKKPWSRAWRSAPTASPPPWARPRRPGGRRGRARPDQGGARRLRHRGRAHPRARPRQTAELAHGRHRRRADPDVATSGSGPTADLASTQIQAQADLAGELSRLALGATEKVVEGSLDEPPSSA